MWIEHRKILLFPDHYYNNGVMVKILYKGLISGYHIVQKNIIKFKY